MTPGMRARADSIADRWELYARTPLSHVAGCGCSGGPGCVTLDAASIETELLESLVIRSRTANQADTSAAVLKRLREAHGAEVQPFSAWVRTIPEIGLSGASQEWLLSSIERFVDSLKPTGSNLSRAGHSGASQ